MMKRNNKTFVIFMSTIFAVISLLTIDSQSQETLKGWKILEKTEMADIKWGTGLVKCSPIVDCIAYLYIPCEKKNGECYGVRVTPSETVKSCVDGTKIRCERTVAGLCYTALICVEDPEDNTKCIWEDEDSSLNAYTCSDS